MPHAIRLRALLAAGALLILAACGRSESPATSPPAADMLPALSGLAPGGLARQASASSFELLDSLPLAQSAAGITLSNGDLTVDSTTGGMAWAVFALQGFPTDGSIVPVSVDVAQVAPCWIAFSDFGAGRWEIVSSDASGKLTPQANELVSPGGVFYVAVIGHQSWTKVNSLLVNTSADLPLPTPNLTTLSATGELAAGIPSYFSAAGSDPGSGAAYDTITFDWNDGSPVDTTTDPAQEVNHTWATTGSKTVTVTVLNDAGLSVSKNFSVFLAQPFREMLVVYNSDIPESADLKDYYCSSRNGRLIDPAYVLGLPLGSGQIIVERDVYVSSIREPIKAFITDNDLMDAIKYILLVKGVPYKINGTQDFDGPPITATASSVDSELCTLFDDDSYPYESWLWNGPVDEDPNPYPNGFYLRTGAFIPNTFVVTSDNNDQQYTLNYLVGRLSAYTFDNVRQILDRAIASDKSGTGWVIFDSRPALYGNELDTMVDPVYPYGDGEDSGYELLSAAGFNAYQDITFDLIVSTHASLPAGSAENVIGYCSWGVHSGFGSRYILDDLGFQYRPGAVFMSYESYNGTSFEESSLTSHPGQGQLCDFLYMGGTVGICNTWEPYTIGVGDERIVFSRYIIHGDRWIEAAYKGLRLLSWMEVVVGDPLCKVK